jgi:hypothetical protein
LNVTAIFAIAALGLNKVPYTRSGARIDARCFDIGIDVSIEVIRDVVRERHRRYGEQQRKRHK